MSSTCSSGHPWSDGAPACGCDAAAPPAGYVPILLEAAPEDRPHAGAAATATVATMPPPAPVAPILSDDGWWQWDGSAWVPAHVPPLPVQAALPDAGPTAGPGATVVDPPWSHAGAASPPAPQPTGWGPPIAHLPPGYVGPGYADPAQGGRDGLAVAALVCSLIPIFVVTQLLAVVFAIIVLTRVGRTGKKGQVMAICAIGVSVVMFFISAAIAIPVFLNQRQIGDDAQARTALRSAANLEESFYTENQTYADAAQLRDSGEQVPTDLDMVVAAGSSGYCLSAGRAGGSRWLMYDSFDGGLQPTVFASAQVAIDTCADSALAGSAGAGGSSPGPAV